MIRHQIARIPSTDLDQIHLDVGTYTDFLTNTLKITP